MSAAMQRTGPCISLASPTTLGDVLLRAAARAPRDVALVFPDRRWTYGEIAEGALSVARSLAALDVRRGDAVGLLLPNGAEFVFALFGTQLLGAVSVPINTRFRSRELGHVIDHAELRIVLTRDEPGGAVDYIGRLYETFPDLATAREPLSLALERAPSVQAIAQLGGADRAGLLGQSAFSRLADKIPAEEVERRRLRVRVRDIAMMLFTSGTTALPKGCLLTHEAVTRVWDEVGRRLGIGPSDRVFDPLPLFHMSGIGPTIFTFLAGARLINMPHFEPGEALDLIEREQATWLYTMFPPVTMGLITHPTFASRDLSAVRAIMNVAPAETLATIGRAFAGIPSLQGPFGMTEAGGAITCHAIDVAPEDRTATTGPPLPGVEVEVIDPENGARLPAGQPGELLVRGYGLFEGYFKDPEATRAAVDADGWLHTGDLGDVDERGWVTYRGRLKEMLKVGGENVAPSEIESHLAKHPAVKLAQVVGIPDERLGEVPAAFVELNPGQTVDAEAIVAFCRGQIASFKVPRHVRFVETWPMSATKVQKSRLAELLMGELGIPSGGSAS